MLKTMRPRLKDGTFYIPVADGVSFRNQQGFLDLKGRVIYRWMEKLAPYLNGRYTLEEITQGLDPDKQAWVADLLEILQTGHFLKDVSLDHPHTLSQAEEEVYASAIAYIDAFQDSGAYRFERFRQRRVLVIGSGLTCTALVHAILNQGICQLAVLTTEECETDTRRYQEYLDLFHQRDARQTLAAIAAPEWQDEVAVRALLEPFDTILHVSDRPMLARAATLNRICFSQKKLLVHATLFDTHAWLGPLTDGVTQGCWECAWLRLQSHPSSMQSSCTFQDNATAPVNHVIALPTAALVANTLSFELFKYCTGAGPQQLTGNMLDIDLTVLRIQQHTFLQHPLCRTCSSPIAPTRDAFLKRIQDLEQREPIDQDYFPRRVGHCFGERLSLFSSLDITGYDKAWLSFCRATVSNPPGFEIPEHPLLIAEVGQGFYHARRRLVQRACEVYAANMVDRRRLVSTEEVPGATCMVLPDRILGGEDLTDAKDWIWALQLHTGEMRLIPAPLVFPILYHRTPKCETGPGVVSGMDWASAVCRALLNWCQRVTLMQMSTRKEPYPQVDLYTTPLYIENMRQRYILNAARDIAKVYDVTGPLQIPTFAICLADTTITYSTHVNVAQALRDGLEQLMQHHQSKKNHHPEYALATVPELPLALRGNIVELPDYESPQGWPACQQWLQEKLHKSGWQPLVVPLDHDPALAEILPSIVHVLLARAQDERKK